MISKVNLHNSFLAGLLSVFFFFIPLGASPVIIWFCLFVFYFLFFQAFSSPISIVTGVFTYFKIDLLFYLFYYFLFFYPYQTFVLGFDSISSNFWVRNTFIDYSNKAIVASTIGLLGFNMGFSKKFINNIFTVYKDYSKRQYQILYVFFVFLCIIFFILFFIKGGFLMLSGSYNGAIAINPSIDGLYILLSVFISVLGGFTIIFYYKYNSLPFLFIPALIVFLIYCYLTLVGGDRNTFFIVMIALFGAYYSFIKTLNKKLLVLFAFMGLILYQVMEVSRTAEDRSLTAFVDVVSGDFESSTKTQVGTNLDESSFSITNLVTRSGFYFVPNHDEFTFGKYLVIGLAGIIPYARGLIIDPSDPDQASSFYITRVNGSTFGLGSSIILDSYLEFGLLGVFFMPYFLGILGKYLQFKAQHAQISLKWCTMYLLALATFAEIPRYTFDFIVKNLGWAFIIFFIFELIMVKRTRVSK